MLALGEKPLSIPLLECSPVSVFCCVTFHLLCGLTKYTIVATAMLAVGLGVSQALFSPGHWHPSTDVRSRTAVVMSLHLLWELWRQLRLTLA